MKWFGVSAPLLLVAAMLCAGQSRSSAPVPSSRTPILVELFTSEGCSSCPPADDVLQQLDRQQPVAGAEIIVMSEHVDYWNSLGWRDPFSAELYTDRQNAYASSFGNGNIYTPQMVVDGQAEFIGNDLSEAIGAVAGAAHESKSAIAIQQISSDGASTRFRVQLETVPALASGDSADVYLAIVENNLSSKVVRGENKGHLLSHVAVVRVLNTVGHLTPSRPFSAESTIRISNNWKRADLQVIAFVQTNRKRHIVALSRVSLL